MTYIGGVFDLAINSSFSLMSSLSLGYSSNLSAKPKEEKNSKSKFQLNWNYHCWIQKSWVFLDHHFKLKLAIHFYSCFPYIRNTDKKINYIDILT